MMTNVHAVAAMTMITTHTVYMNGMFVVCRRQPYCCCVYVVDDRVYVRIIVVAIHVSIVDNAFPQHAYNRR